MIHYKKGNVLEASEMIIAHGCNCSGGFGSGVAGQIAQKWPEVRAAYMNQHNSHGWELGFVQYVDVGSQIIANCGTQLKYLPRGICHADYPAIAKTMQQVKKYAVHNGFSIAIPKIGAGLAGGDWTIIEGILTGIFDDYDITVYEL
jgi:O-acetyl-ADP-ribose deacetylase (regulator of RNase III)